jgi:hypothetical protein
VHVILQVAPLAETVCQLRTCCSPWPLIPSATGTASSITNQAHSRPPTSQYLARPLPGIGTRRRRKIAAPSADGQRPISGSAASSPRRLQRSVGWRDRRLARDQWARSCRAPKRRNARAPCEPWPEGDHLRTSAHRQGVRPAPNLSAMPHEDGPRGAIRKPMRPPGQVRQQDMEFGGRCVRSRWSDCAGRWGCSRTDRFGERPAGNKRAARRSQARPHPPSPARRH